MLLLLETETYRVEVRYDEFAQNPRTNEASFGHLVCWHHRYRLGDEHSFAEPRDFLEHLALELATEEDVEPFVQRKFGDGVWYDNETDSWFFGEDLYGYEDRESAEQALEKEKEWYRNEEWVQDAKDEELLAVIARHAFVLPVYLYDHSGLALSMSRFSCQWDSGQVGWMYVTHEEILREYGDFHSGVLQLVKSILQEELKRYEDFINGNVFLFYVENKETKQTAAIGNVYEQDLETIPYLSSDVVPETLFESAFWKECVKDLVN
ncbi:hypothetical protein [Geobacillus subterraneus]|uniref:Uncharacterized protein n=1 Tax=Geobacillus subterraneus TaxID=129338 RepID=A0A679FV86_9BACL|nr:hypothetical protein [Geobacillus subterraneus]BBW98899.1 hypothetical protein GsuE55_37320 [Geobacillus subterraneus]